ncbi:MAG: hypothetical protein ACPG7F_15275, partial [Aggregatilineales bacterium]
MFKPHSKLFFLMLLFLINITPGIVDDTPENSIAGYLLTSEPEGVRIQALHAAGELGETVTILEHFTIENRYDRYWNIPGR